MKKTMERTMEKTMERTSKRTTGWKTTRALATLLAAAMAAGSLSGCAVWRAERAGRAELARATYAKQVIEIEAQQQLVAETFRAEAEVVRANGIAEAMEIISAELTPEYLKHFWIRTLANHEGVIYVSIEGGYPALLAAMAAGAAPEG